MPLHSSRINSLGVELRAEYTSARISFTYQKLETLMLTLNEQRSGKPPSSIGEAKFLVVLESDSLEELGSPEAKRMALDIASHNGWSHAGLADTNPNAGAVDESTDEIITSLDPKVKIKCYRVEFMIAKRL